MYVECFTNNAKPYLRLVKSVRVVNQSGNKIPQKQVVLNIGPLSRFDDGQPDYVGRLKKSFKAGNPLIPSLKPYCSQETSPETYRFSIKEGSPDCFGHPKLFSCILLERILEELGLNTFFSSYKGFTKLEYDVYGFAKLLVFGRILNPASKSATVRQNDDYYEPILKEGFNPDNVFDTLDFIYENMDRIIRRMNTNLVKKGRRSPEIIYYDVTNFYFEIEEPDDDILDEEGNVIEKGQRKMGVCKEERKLPIVQMGLFIDDDGIPIAIGSFPGNTLDHLTLRPALKRSIDNLDFSRFILIADWGICNYMNLLHVLDAGNGYIVSKSLLKSTQKEQEWTYSDDGYIKKSEDFNYKSRIMKRTVKDENGNSRTIEEKVVVYWSRKFQARSERENKKFLDFLEKLEESPENFRITALQSKSLRKFMKKEYVNKKTGEAINSSDIKAFVDFDKVAEYRKSMGYYQIITSELTMEPLEVIDKYHGLTQIEDQFHAMKSDLETRPIYVRTPEHVTAHLLTCMIALVVLRIIQKRLTDSGTVKVSEDAYWSYGLSVERIQAALNKWKVDKLPGDLYRFMDADDPDLLLILHAFGIEIPPKLYRRADLKSIKTGIKIFK
ncbi:MAG: IS1634 family transposase [Lachnospiraceae bacterium]|nr:IS1634 family transposase [Lachnospiraceae bacterium]